MQTNIKRYYNTNGDLVRYEIIKTEMRDRGKRYHTRHKVTRFVTDLALAIAIMLPAALAYLIATA